jgi:hypothetical protein
VDVAEKDSKTVTVELSAQQAAASAPTDNSSESETAPTPEQPAGRSGASKVLLFGGFGLAGAGAIAGTITGLLSISKTNSIKSSGQCNGNVCGTGIDSDYNSAKTMATISTVSFIVAGAGAVAGVVGLLTGTGSSSPAAAPSDPSEPAADKDASARIEPWFGLGSLGLRGRF